MSFERRCKRGLTLLRCDGYSLSFDFHSLREAARFGIGSRQGIKDCGILRMGKRLRVIRKGDGVRSIANGRVGRSCEQAGGQVEIGDTIGISLQRQAQMSEGIGELSL